MPGTVRLHRVLRAPAERVYRAFTNPHAMAKWSPPDGFYAIYDHLEPEVGGTYKASFINFTTGEEHSFGGEFKEMIENERIRYIDIFDDPNLPGAMEVTVSLKPVSCGTELTIVQDGIPDVIPVEMCYLGWQESMLALARLVEPEIKQ
ncbi:SRPBCC family protein [Microbulbifer sp. YPW1]|uniref:SRPBCC family protein n=1 Tax=Microbulbifer sp. YPW1 TaxID=2745199 RepID=UPI001C62C714|nr:SRPBCC family protein [Microbulbifer sp. YPW1]